MDWIRRTVWALISGFTIVFLSVPIFSLLEAHLSAVDKAWFDRVQAWYVSDPPTEWEHAWFITEWSTPGYKTVNAHYGTWCFGPPPQDGWVGHPAIYEHADDSSVVLAGYPFHCAVGGHSESEPWWHDRIPSSTTLMVEHPTRNTLDGLPLYAMVPLTPIWSGLALNTLIYAAALFGLWHAPFFTKATVRRLRRRCPACGYDARGLPACPECGRERKALHGKLAEELN